MAKLIGTDPNQVPTNADLGTMAYQDYNALKPQLLAGGNRNLIINGNFQVSQRGDFTSASGVSNQSYYLDRWVMSVGISGTLQDTGYKAKVVCTSTGSGVLAMSQNIEDKNIHPFKGKTVTVSCKMTSNSPNARIVIYADNWLSLGNQNDVHSGSGNEETLSATFTVPSNLAGILQVRVGFDNEASNGNPSLSTNDYFEVSDIQLELGDTATPFEHRSYGDELARCMRYFQKPNATYDFIWTGDVTSGNTYYHREVLPVSMRATPTYTSLSVFESRFGGGISANPQNNNVLQITAVSTSTGARGYFEGTYQLDAEL